MENLNLNFKNNFFPYIPYACQELFMEKIYETLLNKKAGIFESPTGTGKSLSILCGVLKYLDGVKNKNNIKSIEDKNEDDWLNSFGENVVEKIKINPSLLNNNINNKRKHSEIHKNNQKQNNNTKLKNENKITIKDDTQKMLINDNIPILLNNFTTKTKNDKLQIFFLTRTHSQIAQVISEIKKIKNNYFSKNKINLDFSFTSLGSRKLLCINKKVNNPNSNFFNINEKCLDSIQSESNNKCPYYNSELIDSFSNEISNKVYDIEELYKLGEDISACPYYSSRKGMNEADVIILSYNSIINSNIRKSLNIDLENKILIFDEAHNLIENVLQTFNAEITLDNLILILIGLNLYYEKYSLRLKSSSNMLLRQLIKICESFIDLILNDKIEKKNKNHNLSEILIEMDISNMNIFNLINFIQETELHNKIKWTLEKIINENIFIKDDNKNVNEIISKYLSKNINPHINLNLTFEILKKLLNSFDLFSGFSDLLNSITYTNEDGKIIFEEINNIFINKKLYGKIKYIMVNPCREFDHIIKNSKCVIFAGGTMKPLEEFELLLKSLKKEEIVYFEGSHVVDKSNIFVSNIICNFTNFEKLLFNHQSFAKDELFLLENILKIVKLHSDDNNLIFPNDSGGKGIVVFLHSYTIIEKIKNLNQRNKIIKSDIFYEERLNNTGDNIFQLYQDNIKLNDKKTILFAVVGGKLSEGINFSDDLARIVLVFGLPYPNITSHELKIKMNYYDHLSKDGIGKVNGEEYYENICMKAVNQSIGRSIRHKNDYAVIVLVDLRYSKDKIKNKLPKWILNSEVKIVNSENSLDDYKNELKEFFYIKENLFI